MKQFLILLGMFIAVDAWSKNLYICSVARFHGGGAEVTKGVEYKELHTFIFKKANTDQIKILTDVGAPKLLLLSKNAEIQISANAQRITFNDAEEDIFGFLDFYEQNIYFGKIIIHADFAYNVQCIKQLVRKGSVY